MPKVSETHISERRKQILDAAARCFARNGFHQTTMRDIYREAGLSPGAIYHYFSSKEEIIEACARDRQDSRVPRIERALQKDGTLQILEALVDQRVERLQRPETEVELRMRVNSWAEAQRSPTVRETLLWAWNNGLQRLEEVIIQAQRKGEINPDLNPLAVARLLLALADGLALQKTVDPSVQLSEYAEVEKALFSGRFWQPSQGFEVSATSDRIRQRQNGERIRAGANGVGYG